ncbi:MAG: hypothetical protein ACRBBN_16960 [Methyloligellaceae bacterium]
MKKKLIITCERPMIDPVTDKIQELDASAEISVGSNPKMSGVVEALSIIASLSTIAASSFVIWAELQKKEGKEIDVEESEEKETKEEE